MKREKKTWALFVSGSNRKQSDSNDIEKTFSPKAKYDFQQRFSVLIVENRRDTPDWHIRLGQPNYHNEWSDNFLRQERFSLCWTNRIDSNTINFEFESLFRRLLVQSSVSKSVLGSRKFSIESPFFFRFEMELFSFQHTKTRNFSLKSIAPEISASIKLKFFAGWIESEMTPSIGCFGTNSRQVKLKRTENEKHVTYVSSFFKWCNRKSLSSYVKNSLSSCSFLLSRNSFVTMKIISFTFDSSNLWWNTKIDFDLVAGNQRSLWSIRLKHR